MDLCITEPCRRCNFVKKLLSLILRLAGALYGDFIASYENSFGFISNYSPEKEFARDFISSMSKEYCLVSA